jgi:ankyrin repeat protein
MQSDESFGLTKNMQAAALGDIDAIKAVPDLRGLFEERNHYTNANILHYAAQALNNGDAIIEWAILEANAPIKLLSERILVQREGRVDGNGHTVAMEAVFNRNAEVVEALIRIRESYPDEVDLKTPALTGWSPRGFALREGLPFAGKLPPADQTYQQASDAQKRYVEEENKKWLKLRPSDEAAFKLADGLREYVLEGGSPESISKLLDNSGVEVNGLYGRLGQPLLNLVPTGLSAGTLLPVQQLRYASVIDLLLAAGADPRIKETGLMQVSAGFRDAVFGYRDGLERMIKRDHGGKEQQTFINERGIMNGYTRLIDAALTGRTNIIELLLDNGADKHIKGFNGRTAFDAALTYNKTGRGEKISDQVLERLRA